MASIEYSDSPNVDTAFVVQEGGQKNRAVLTAPQDTSTLELPDNPNSTKGYVTVDGKKHKVILTANIAGGGGGGDVSSVNGKTGAVVLDAKDVGAAEGIKWATSIDVPSDFEYGWNCYPIYTITGGLPDGEYDFYWQVKCQTEAVRPFGLATYHARIKIDNTEHTFYGMFEPVVNDSWFPDANYIPTPTTIWYFMYKNGSDLILYATEQQWSSDIPPYMPGVAIPECFKISVIKNVNTGVEYTPTGELYDGDDPIYDISYTGNIEMKPLAQTPTLPTYHVYRGLNYVASNRYIYIGEGVLLSTSLTKSVCSEIDFAAKTQNGTYHIIIENGADKYVARVIEATGDLASAQMCAQNNGILYFDFNNAGNSGSIDVFLGFKGSENGCECYLQPPQSSVTPLDIAKVGSTVGIYNFGLIEQYTGTTDANYTNGYFYKADGTIVTTPQSLTADNLSISGTPVNDITISIDISNLITALETSTGWSENTIKEYLLTYTGWNIVYNFDNSTVASIMWNAYGGIDDSGVLSCFTVTTTGTYSGSQTIDFIGEYSPETQTVTGGAWTRVDVQPAPSGLPDQTGNSGKFLTTDGSSASWSNKPLVNKSTGTDSLSILGATTYNPSDCVLVGYNSMSTASKSVAVGRGAQNNDGSNVSVGYGAQARGQYSIAIGTEVHAWSSRSIGIGGSIPANAVGAIQIGRGSNSESGTVCFGLTADGGSTYTNCKILENNGTIPADRLGSTTGLSAGNYRLRLTVDAQGNATLSWVAE